MRLDRIYYTQLKFSLSPLVTRVKYGYSTQLRPVIPGSHHLYRALINPEWYIVYS